MRYIEKLGSGKNSRKPGRIAGVALLLAFLVGIGSVEPALASKTEEAQGKKEEAEAGLNSANSEIGRIETEQQALQQEIDALDAELVAVIVDLGILETDLQAAEEHLALVQADLKQAQLDEANQYENMKMRIRFMYERGDTAFLTSILESKSMADLLNRVEYVNEVYDYDRELLIQYQTTKLQVAELELQVQGEIAEMEELQVIYQDEQARYEDMIAQRQSQMADFSAQLAEAKNLAEQYQATIDAQNEIIRQEEEKRRQEEERRRQEEEERQRQEAANSSNNSGNSNSDSDKNENNDTNSGSGGGLNPGFTTGVSGSAVVDYACQFIGNPYVYGGTDINNGIDCSAYIQYVYRKFGISLPRTSYEQRKVGQEVSYSNAQPGDIICYSGHVAIYMGNGQIVHASNPAAYPAGGIKISSATYRRILSVRRVL